MSIRIKIESGAFNVKVKDFENKTIRKVADELNRFGQKTVADAKRLSPHNEGYLRGTIAYDPASPAKLDVKVSVAANYAAYLEFGTRKFAAAYVATLPKNWQAYAATFKGKAGGSFDDLVIKLVEWVKKKGLHRTSAIHDAQTGERHFVKARKSKAQKEEDADQIAYAIAIKIMREGIEPHPFFIPAIEKNLIELKNRLK